MKKYLLALAVFVFTLGVHSQNTLSADERKILIEELKREILDSLRIGSGPIVSSADSIKAISVKPWKGTIDLSAYVEAYYLYDFNNPANGNRPAFVYSHNRHNEFNVNLALIKFSYTAPRLRTNLAIMAGTYSNANLSAEPGVLKNIYEANAGINLSKKKQLWLDIGVFASHIGFESAIGKDCWNMTRSILADNSPYYESGIKLSYTSDNGKLFASVLVLNGWQRIQKVNGNSLPSFGWQITGKPNDKILINSSSFIGTDKDDATRQMRYFHNLYAIFNITEKFGLTTGFDIGAEQKAKGSKTYNVWYSPVLIARYQPINKLALAARFEYYSDRNGVVISTGTPNGFATLGYSLNVDVIPVADALIRIEGRLLQSRQDEIFEQRNGSFTKLSPSIGLSFAYSFAHQFK
jgi:hypothetical protein